MRAAIVVALVACVAGCEGSPCGDMWCPYGGTCVSASGLPGSHLYCAQPAGGGNTPGAEAHKHDEVADDHCEGEGAPTGAPQGRAQERVALSELSRESSERSPFPTEGRGGAPTAMTATRPIRAERELEHLVDREYGSPADPHLRPMSAYGRMRERATICGSGNSSL
jgi:hypothetical protein